MKSKIKLTGDIIALDVGTVRTGVARLHTIAQIAEPLTPINHRVESIDEAISRLLEEHNPVGLIIGLPRGLDGQETQQTQYVRDVFSRIETLTKMDNVPVFLIDEAGSTIEAERRATPAQSVDSVAAGVIAETWAHALANGEDAHYEI